MKPRVLLIDNKDSFTYNLVQALAGLGAEVVVRRNDEIDVPGARRLAPSHLVVSPGPGRPERAGATLSLLEAFVPHLPVLGVCLGHQALAQLFGGSVVRAARPMHGKVSHVYHDGRTIYEGLMNPFVAGRYHSLVVTEDSLAPPLKVSAYTSDGEIMGLRHESLPVEGVQFHPESILTPSGTRILGSFLGGHSREVGP